MKRKDVLILAASAGIEKWWDTPNATDEGYTRALERFAALVSAAERERCAAECERMMMYPGGRQESAAHNNVWAAAEAILALKDEASE